MLTVHVIPSMDTLRTSCPLSFSKASCLVHCAECTGTTNTYTAGTRMPVYMYSYCSAHKVAIFLQDLMHCNNLQILHNSILPKDTSRK